MPDIGLVQVDVYEVPEPAVLLQQVPLEAAVGRKKAIEHLANRAAGKLDAVPTGSEAAQRSGN
jgi:hypothetical protein